MAHTILFGNFSKRQNSTKQPDVTGWASFECVLKGGSSFETPEVTLNAEDFAYNYAVFRGKYYFVVEVIAERNNFFRVRLQLDALASYKAEILASTQFVSYSSVSGGAWLADTRIPVLRDCIVGTASTPLSIFSAGGLYILSYIGKTASGLVGLGKASLMSLIDSISSSEMTSEIDNIVDQYGQQAWTTSAEQSLYYLARVTTQNDILGKAYETAPSCLRSCIYTPLVVPGSPSQHIYLGNYDTGVTGIPVNGTPITGSVSVSIPWHYSDWRRSTCEQVYLYLPLVGMVNLSADSLTHTDTITINYSYTLTDATVAFQVIAGGEVIGTYGGSCAINYPLGVNQQASAGQVQQAVIQGLTSTVSAGITGNVVGAITGIIGTAYNALDAALTTHPSSVGGIGGGAGSGLSRDIICFTVAHSTVITPDQMAGTMGVPTMQPLQLSACSGYCQCANAHVELDAPLPEIAAVDAWLNSGFYIE